MNLDNHVSGEVPSDHASTSLPTPADPVEAEPTTKTTASSPGAALAMLARIALPVLILAGGTAAYLRLSVPPDKEQSPPPEARPIRTRVAELRVQDYPVTIETNGIVQPHNQVQLSAQVGGQVAKVNPIFEVGAYFEAGDVLVQLEDRDYVTAQAIARAQVLGAESALELARQTYQRKRRLFEKQGLSEAEVTQAEAGRDQAAAQLEAARAQLEQATRDLDRTQVRAPFAGRVRAKTVGVGQSVSAGMPLGTVFAVDFAEVRLPISSQQLPHLQLPELASDTPLSVTLRDAISADNATRWDAQIVRTEGTLDQDSLELFVIARITDPFGQQTAQPPLRIGQPVVATIAGRSLPDVVAIPRGAVRQLDQIFLVDRQRLTLSSRTLVPLWKDSEHVIVRDPTIPDRSWVATTRIVYAPEDATVEIIEDIDPSLHTQETKTPGEQADESESNNKPAVAAGSANSKPRTADSQTSAGAWRNRPQVVLHQPPGARPMPRILRSNEGGSVEFIITRRVSEAA